MGLIEDSISPKSELFPLAELTRGSLPESDLIKIFNKILKLVQEFFPNKGFVLNSPSEVFVQDLRFRSSIPQHNGNRAYGL